MGEYMDSVRGPPRSDVSWLSAWALIFMAATIAISFVLMVALFFPLGLSQANPVVFFLNAAVSGTIADQLLRRFAKVRVLAISHPTLPFVWLWNALMFLCIVVGFDRVNEFIKSLAGL
jgi:hypothetical protein